MESPDSLSSEEENGVPDRIVCKRSGFMPYKVGLQVDRRHQGTSKSRSGTTQSRIIPMDFSLSLFKPRGMVGDIPPGQSSGRKREVEPFGQLC